MGEEGFCTAGQLHQANLPSQSSCSCSHLPSLGSRALQMPLKYLGAFSGGASGGLTNLFVSVRHLHPARPLLVVLQQRHRVSASSHVEMQRMSQHHSLRVPEPLSEVQGAASRQKSPSFCEILDSLEQPCSSHPNSQNSAICGCQIRSLKNICFNLTFNNNEILLLLLLPSFRGGSPMDSTSLQVF